MPDEPPVALVELLAKLQLATPEQVRGVSGRARKLARDLPLFDSVWIDALAQARFLTPFQASEINAGRGDQLLVGPYVLRQRVQRFGFADCFIAAAVSSAEKPTGKLELLHLVVVRGLEQERAVAAVAKLQRAVEEFAAIKADGVARLQGAGGEDGVVWAAYERPAGIPVSDWLSCQGRLSPAAALEIVRQMVAALAALEKRGMIHGDIAASSLWLTDAGEARLVRCGMRGAIGENQGSPAGATVLEVLDYMAPERLTAWEEISPSTIVSDIYAGGCLWWHLLAGRAPIVGGDLENKFLAAQAAKIPDIRRIAPDTPGTLAAVIERCTQVDAALRPQSFAELEKMLGAPTSAGRRVVALELFRSGRRAERANLPRRIQSAVRGSGQPLLAATACALLVAAATWPLWRPRSANRETSTANFTSTENAGRQKPTAQGSLTIFTSRDSSKAALLLTPSHDRTVRQASFQTPESMPVRAKDEPAASSPNRPVIELSGAKEIAGNTLQLQKDCVVRGKNGERPCIAMPPNGLVITADHVRFENVDFVWRQRAEEITSPDRHALLELRGAETEFEGCTFQAHGVGSFELPAAIRLGSQLKRGSALPPAVRVQLNRCTLGTVACGVECVAPGPAAIVARDTLYLGRGPLVRFGEVRRADAPCNVSLEQVTLRGSAAIIEMNCDNGADSVGTVALSTSGCVFAPAESGALVLFSGRRSPKTTGGVLTALDWSCQDSLVSPGTAIATWQHDADHETLPDEDIPLEGLVASQFDFAGEATLDPAASKLRTWLAPLRTEQTPGVGDDLPRLREVQ